MLAAKPAQACVSSRQAVPVVSFQCPVPFAAVSGAQTASSRLGQPTPCGRRVHMQAVTADRPAAPGPSATSVRWGTNISSTHSSPGAATLTMCLPLHCSANGLPRDAVLGVLGGGQLGRMMALAAVSQSVNTQGRQKTTKTSETWNHISEDVFNCPHSPTWECV